MYVCMWVLHEPQPFIIDKAQYGPIHTRARRAACRKGQQYREGVCCCGRQCLHLEPPSDA
jgi:hypothetical protein